MEEYPIATMAMAKAPVELETLLRATARDTGIEIIRDVPVELICWPPDGLDPESIVGCRLAATGRTF